MAMFAHSSAPRGDTAYMLHFRWGRSVFSPWPITGACTPLRFPHTCMPHFLFLSSSFFLTFTLVSSAPLPPYFPAGRLLFPNAAL